MVFHVSGLWTIGFVVVNGFLNCIIVYPSGNYSIVPITQNESFCDKFYQENMAELFFVVCPDLGKFLGPFSMVALSFHTHNVELIPEIRKIEERMVDVTKLPPKSFDQEQTE